MRSSNWAAIGVVIGAIVLLCLARWFSIPWHSNFFSRVAVRGLQEPRLQGQPSFRGPTRLPIPERYIEATRDAVTQRMHAPDWPRLSAARRREVLLQILLLSGVDATYWSVSEARQRQINEAYVRAFLDESARRATSEQ